MSTDLKALGIDRLSVAERSVLVEQIWDSIADDAEQIPLSGSQRQDLERRLHSHRENPRSGSTWEEFKARLRGRA